MSVSSSSNPIVGRLTLGASSSVVVDAGAGAPTGKVALKGSLWIRTDGSSSSTRLYVNSDGDSTWVAITTAS